MGSLLVVGGGDPNISGRFYNDDYNAVFDKWAASLKASGVTRVAGDLILNDSFFDSVLRHPEWPAGQEAKWYQAPVCALAYNDGVVLVSEFGRARAPDGPRRSRSSLRPHLCAPSLGAHRRPAGKRACGGRAGLRVPDAVTVSGTVPLRGVWWSTPIAVDDPAGFFGARSEEPLEGRGDRGLRADRGPGHQARRLLVARRGNGLRPPGHARGHQQAQPGFLRRADLQDSRAPRRRAKAPGTNAVSLEKQFLAALGLDPTRFDLHDGSGLSPQNRVSAADVVRFLRAMNAHPNGRGLEGDPGVPGRARKHAAAPPARRGRPGRRQDRLISGVSTLAGYATGCLRQDLRLRHPAERPRRLGRRRPRLPGPPPPSPHQKRLASLTPGRLLRRSSPSSY